MSAPGGLVAQPLDAAQRLNWVLVVELVLSGVLAVFFLNYVDRIFGTVVSYAIRAYTWRKYNAYIDVQGLQISLLGGRIFFKDLRYHGHNVTVLMHSGFVTWHYWFPRVRQAAVFDCGKTPRDAQIYGPSPRDRNKATSDEESGEVQTTNHKLPCRIKLHVEGVQAFLYNRSPAYDNILDAIHRSIHDDVAADEDSQSDKESPPPDDTKAAALKTKVAEKLSNLWKKCFDSTQKLDQSATPEYCSPEVPSILRCLPIQLVAKTGAVVLGNENTKSIMTVKFDSVSGSIDADEAGPLDFYKIMFSFDIQHPIISLRPNMDYKETLLAAAARSKSSLPSDVNETRHRSRTFWQKLRKRSFLSSADSIRTASASDLTNAVDTNLRQQLPGEQRWLGLSRYVDDAFQNEHDEWDEVEYARSSVLADVPRLGFVFYWDVPGQVPVSSSDEKQPADADHINGDAPPEYGMDLLVHGGSVTYGPWTDRHRINFQNIFFPAVFANAVPGKRLQAGETRVSTEFKLYMSVEEDLTLRLPVKEQSKDWKWRGKAHTMKARDTPREQGNRKHTSKSKRRAFWKSSNKASAGPNARPYGWLDVKIPKNSTINYSMDMVARSSGFRSNVTADIPKLEICTSVNHGLLWRSRTTRVDCDLSVPLGFNTLRQWRFNVINEGLELFILRDHLFLIVDVVADWASGPASDFHTFTPFRYHLDVQMRDFKLFLNANDSNIINDPANLDENKFIVLYGKNLHAKVDIPLDELNPRIKEIPFDVVGRDLSLQLCLTTRNTIATFVGDREVAFLDKVSLSGSFAGSSETSTSLTDRLVFKIHGSNLTVCLFGFVIHHLITLKENYFGEHLHFKTLEEYQDIASGRQIDAEQIAKLQGANRSNDLDIIMCITVQDIHAQLPANIYQSTDCVVVDVPYFGLDLRLTSYYLDLQLNSSPISVSLELSQSGSGASSNGTEVFIQSVEVNGHRAFGLPPTEPAYYSYWSIALGDVSGVCSDAFLQTLVRVAMALSVTVTDDENSLSLIELAPVHDITFVEARTGSVKICVQLDQIALTVSSEPATIEFNDWAGPDFSQRLNLNCPQVSVSLMDIAHISPDRARSSVSHDGETHAYLKTSLSLSVLQRKLHFDAERNIQQEYLVMHDSRTQRVPFLRTLDSLRSSQLLSRDDPPAMAFPSIPEPLILGIPKRQTSRTTSSSSLSQACRSDRSSVLKCANSLRQQQLSHKTSRSSLSASITSSSAKSTIRGSSSAHMSHKGSSQTEQPTGPGGMQPGTTPEPFSFALSSSLAVPVFQQLHLSPNKSQLPPLLDKSEHTSAESKRQARRGSAAFDISDDQTHTSIILDTGQGVQCFVKPTALAVALQLVNLVQAKTANDLLDALQVSIWGTIKDQEGRAHGVGNVFELRVDVPNIALRFLNPTLNEGSLAAAECDQFDVAFRGFSLMGRHSTPGITSQSVESSSIHCILDSMSVSATRQVSAHPAGPTIIGVRLDNLLAWIAIGESQIIHLSFSSLDIDAHAKQVHWVTSMIDRLSRLGDGMTKTVKAMQRRLQHRYALLAYLLTTCGAEAAKTDPIFISRPSFLLRAAAGHVRNHDSWKIVSRYRHIFHTMPHDAKHEIAQMIANASDSLPDDAEAVVVKSWNQWRTWELTDIQKSSAMKLLFNRNDDIPIPAASVEKRLQVSFRTENIRLAVDPGDAQTDFTLRGLSVNIDIEPPSISTGASDMSGLGLHRRILLQINAAGMLCHVDWSIVPVLNNAYTVLREVVSATATTEASKKTKLASRPIVPPVAWIAQGVVIISETSLRVTSPNVDANFANNGMNLSVVGASAPGTDAIKSLSAVLHAGEGRTVITASNKTILVLKATSPTIYASRVLPAVASASTEIDWRVAASSTHLTLDVPCEILDMIEVVDAFVGTELSDVMARLQKMQMSQASAPKKLKSKTTESKLLPKLNLALLMDSYTIRIALLQAIRYNVHGERGRISMQPRLIQQVSLNMNFDLESHVHQLVIMEDAAEHVISTFTLPSINGQLGLRRENKRVAISARTIVEQIELDASAVHALLSTFKRPEVAKTFEAIQADFSTLQEHIEGVMPQSRSLKVVDPSEQAEIVYNISAALTGIRVIAQAPGKSQKSSMATLAIGLSGIQISAYNCLSAQGPILNLPEVQASLKNLFMEMNIQDSKGVRPCGKIGLSASIQCTRRDSRKGVAKRQYRLEVNATQIHLFAETAATVVDVLNHLQDRMKDVNLSREKRYLQRLRQPTRRASVHLTQSLASDQALSGSSFLDAGFAVSIRDVELCWIIGGSVAPFEGHATNDLVLTIKVIDLKSKSRSASRLVIEDFQLQMVPVGSSKRVRSRNSALMPEVVFNVFYISTADDRKVSLQAMCKSLNVRLDSVFILLANVIQRSIILAVNSFRDASAMWEMTPTSTGAQRKNPFGDKRLSAFLVDVDFAGAVVEIKDRRPEDRGKLAGRTGESHYGRFGQFSTDGETAGAVFRTPGIAMKGEYEDDGKETSFTAEFKISGSTNALNPTVVPLVMDMSNSVKLIVEASGKQESAPKPVEKQESTLAQSIFSDERLLNADPSAILGKTRFNLGVRICRQEFSLGCQPIARVDAAVILDDIYIAANSVRTPDQDIFFAISGSVENLQASVQHVYSRESTFSFNMERLALSIMNSKHVSGKAGISAVLKIYPMKTHINARQLQDFLLFRDIWLPKEIRQSSGPPRPSSEPQDYLVQRYQQVATATAFPWTASVSIQSVEIDLDMGQAIGKASLQITDLWAASKKNSNWEQNLCLGIERVAVQSTGRTSGFVELAGVQVRTSISWPLDEQSVHKTPLIQASMGFDRLRVKTAFDYEAFGIVDIADFAFVMYNIREEGLKPRDRLVAILDGDSIQVCCTAQSAAQGYALFQAVERLIQENQMAYSASLKDIERYLKRKSVVAITRLESSSAMPVQPAASHNTVDDAAIFLHTDVVVTLRSINLGAFPGSFSDNTVFLIEAKDIQGRFAVKMDNHRIHNGLGMTFGKVQVALTSTPQPSAPKTLQEITVEDVTRTMVKARGGIILRVPKVVARMQTWQSPGTNHIDYIFRSSFEGKVDVGWNFSRIAFIRDMYNSHVQSLASRLGRALPESAVKITTALDHDSEAEESSMPQLRTRAATPKTEKITAVVNVPQSKYDYTALEPPIIDTPQLRDMGEATPPLEWIGLHRDRLPNVTHQILIVGLLGVARNVEEAYERILGGSERK